MKYSFLIIALIFISLSSFSQHKIKVEEDDYSFSVGRTNALSVTIYESNKDDVEKEWKKFIKDYKAKVSIKKEIFADDAEIKDISSNVIDVYAVAEVDKDGNVILYVGFDLGGAFLSSSQHPDKFRYAKDMMYKFGKEATLTAIDGHLEAEGKILKKKESEQEKLVKENEQLLKNIADWEKSIEKAKADIETNKKDQELKLGEIEAQKKVVEEITDKKNKVD
ncbi:MAG: hypothetical protein A2W91_11855 [Bacteroidetes bacterium GWF2_38_335]|nr:MAG: hypothetical protein A2W91_11855 [Bacteroidetes bacterium GWF2_38_335]OFY77972.1 MAG: hypothetical protein A2281_18600 [Bacteroidetes bacterium RIFOXYA12_FULL_38_20]HBS86715.1 hypothetical protein [Bacteroidales bacterium]